MKGFDVERRTVVRMMTWLVMAIALTCASDAIRAQDVETKAAQMSAETWLSLVDHESYAESWTAAASGFKNAVSQERWEALVSAARGPLGILKERSLRKATTTKTVPGAPDGEYVVFQFGTSFEHKAAAIEIVTAVKDTDGTWHVGGYFMK